MIGLENEEYVKIVFFFLKERFQHIFKACNNQNTNK